jgi:preprotein translocase subunit SecA
LILTRNIDSKAEHEAYQLALYVAQKMSNGRDFVLDAEDLSVRLSQAGRQILAKLNLPEDGLWQNTRRREELVCKGLHALHLLHRDRDYLVKDNKVVMIDANTGRTMPDRSWERGLHQMVEAKEGCPLTAAREQLGRLTYQRFFRRYLRLGGMTGTAREVSSELWSTYGLRIKRIPLHRPSQRLELPARIYSLSEEKWAAVINSVTELRQQGRPILVGTGSVSESELLSDKLKAAGVPHRVINASQDKEEADIVAAAGKLQQVTVATNMAGRGTDIPLAKGVAELGGLHVIATCRNEARRIDRQLIGRCARQGDPGSHQAILSLEEELGCHDASTPDKILRRRTVRTGPVRHKLHLYRIRRAQMRIERRHREARRRLLQHDGQTGRRLAFSGHME